MSTKKDIGSVFKTALDGYSATPDNLWPDIEAGLKKQRRNRWIVLLLLALLLLLLGYAGWNWLRTDTNDSSTKNPIEVSNGSDSKDSKDSIVNDSTDISSPVDSSNAKESNSLKNWKEETKNSKNQKMSEKFSDVNIPKSSDRDASKDETDEKKNDQSKIGQFNNQKGLRRQQLIPFDLVRVDSLQLVLDSLQLYVPDLDEELKQKKKEEFRWRVMPFASADHYNAFGRNTSAQLELNRGAFIMFQGTDKLFFRTGHKEMSLQYNFRENNADRQQKVKYMEIPLEIRYFLSNKSSFKPTLIVGSSFLFLQEAFLRDFSNDFIRDNRDAFTKHMFSANVGLGLHYDIDPRWTINLESWFKYHPYPYNKRQNFYTYVLSLSFGIEYKFNFK
jgi:hypothetical protein